MSRLKDIYPGKYVKVFDTLLWRKNGGDHRTDLFMRHATIKKVYLDYLVGLDDSLINIKVFSPFHHKLLADVIFDHDGRESFGHFVNVMEEVTP